MEQQRKKGSGTVEDNVRALQLAQLAQFAGGDRLPGGLRKVQKMLGSAINKKKAGAPLSEEDKRLLAVHDAFRIETKNEIQQEQV